MAGAATRHYLFGYGSLISGESRTKTGKTGEYINAVARGLQRRWNLRHKWSWPVPELETPLEGMTAVGVIHTGNVEHECTGVLFEVAEDELPAFDEREVGYTRSRLPAACVFSWSEDGEPAPFAPSASVWVYTINEPHLGCPEFPIPQSYVDVIVTGALEVSEKFAERFIATTDGWEHWVNDRRVPLYVRHSENALARAEEVDAVLNKCLEMGCAGRQLVTEASQSA